MVAFQNSIPDDFDDEDEIDNPYLPLEEGSIWAYKGDELFDVVVVTDQTKEIQGVETTVVFDIAFSEGAVAEITFDWFAQDEDGNVWYFGENTAEIENGQIANRDGSWEAGVDGAEAGIIMLAEPKVGQTYNEEFAPGVAEDQATVISLDASEDVPFGSFDHLLETHNFTPLDLTALETKFYAKGIGNILTIDETTGEREELVFFREGDDDDDDDDDDDEDDDDHGSDDCGWSESVANSDHPDVGFAAFDGDWALA